LERDTLLEIDIEDELKGLEITPLVLIPFIENAFKHIAENEKGESFIKIKIFAVGNQLECLVSNSINPSFQQTEKSGGIGLHNVKRRLALSYPDKHELELDKTENTFSSSLKITLS